MRIDFSEVSIKGVKHWTEASGNKRQQTRKFFQTINPFNRNADGTVKTREQIMVEITADRDAWLAQPHPQPAS